MKAFFLSLVALLVLSACGKAVENGSPANALVGSWKMTTGPAGVVAGSTFVYNTDGSCALTNGTSPRPTTDACAYDGTTLKLTSAVDGLTDEYAVTISGTGMSILQRSLPESYRFSFVRQ